MVEIVVQLRGQGDALTTSLEHVQRDLVRRGVRLEPLHRGSTESELRAWYLVTFPEDDVAADVVVRELQIHPDVEAAYAKPPGEAP